MVPKIKLLAGSDEFESYAAGEAIFREGDPGECMYCVKTGVVEVVAGGRVLETLEAGHVFGEMALVDNQPRSATARAKTDCQVVPIDEKTFFFLVQQTPNFALQLMRVLSERLRQTTRR
jgi:CRP-like cAMP-binding protein